MNDKKNTKNLWHELNTKGRMKIMLLAFVPIVVVISIGIIFYDEIFENETDSQDFPKLNPYIDFAEDLGFENEEMNVSTMNFAMYVLSNMKQSYRADVVLGIFLQSAENNGELTIPQVYILDVIMYKDNRQYLCNREGQTFCESFDTVYEEAHSIGLTQDAVDAVSRLWIAKSAGMEKEKDNV